MSRIISILFIVSFLASCRYKTSTHYTYEGKCYLTEESFENSKMREFLEHMQHKEPLMKQYLEDTSKLAYFSFKHGNTIFASLKEDGRWDVKTEKAEYQVYSDSVTIKLEAMASLNMVYALTAPKNFGILSNDNGLRAFWIKSNGSNKFLYYSIAYSTWNLNNTDREKVLPLEEINDLFAGK